MKLSHCNEKHVNKLWIFEVWSIASWKTWVGSTKIMIQHDLQIVYIYNVFSPLQAYFLSTHRNGKSQFYENYLSKLVHIIVKFHTNI